ncbi:putative taz1-interacting factor 1 [Phaeomoniella chlamydospora]|uniref:Autophagy-related protein 11 n=1 Tax=Phaeomoniella chlamydospora TaxID=158046 RepID=A0A0G2GU05_PHACM|nr:putative taz1-interacting factor 1 [Phaeomoniella chlamydospora]
MQTRLAETRTWAQETIKDQKAAVDGLEDGLKTLSRIPARKEYTFLLRRPSTPTKRSTKSNLQGETLQAFVNVSDLQNATAQMSRSSQALEQAFNNVDSALHNVASETITAVEDVQSSPSQPLSEEDIANLFEESETFAKKINSDYEHILRLPDNSKSIASTSRMALGHTRDFLPSLKAVAQEIDQAVRTCIQTRNAAVRSALHNMQNISVIESGLASIQGQIQSLDVDEDGLDAFDTLDLVYRLPVAYASVLVESVRRSEWDEKIKADSASLAEEMALYKDEEQHRRRKWMKSMAPFIDETQDMSATEMEINLRGTGDAWPRVSREEIDNYAESLRKSGDLEGYEEVIKMIRELDSPTKQQRKRAKAFKNGSVFDVGFGLGRSSLLLRGEDESTRSLKDENSKLSDKLKASESRVRRLEAILHNSGPLSRPASGAFGMVPSEFERNVSSPIAPPSPRLHDGLSRRSSVSSRRMSSNQTTEERSLAARVVSLEAELLQERDAVSRLQKEAHAERRSSTESRDRMNEAESTKKDLLANFEAQRLEFEHERQLLEDETHKLKIRLEEAEDELDRVIGSRDQEKMIADRNVRDLRAQLEQALKTIDDEREQAQEEIDSFQSAASKQQDRLSQLEKQLQDQDREKSSLQAQNIDIAGQLRDAVADKTELITSLQAAHAQLSPEGLAPDDLGKLVSAIEILSEGLAIHARSSDELAQLVSAENKQLETRIAKAESDVAVLKDDVVAKELETIHVKEALSEERSKLGSLRAELVNEQTELKNLRDRLADGETGSSELRDRLSTEQQRVGQLTEQLAGAQAIASNHEQEILVWKDKLQKAIDSEQQLKSHLDGRGRRSNELSRRVYAQNDRMIRVMEQMGYAITRQDDHLVIQRASKANSNSTTLAGQVNTEAAATSTRSIAINPLSPPANTPEIPGVMNRSLSGAYTLQHYSDAADLDLLYWSDNDANLEDEKYQSFLASLNKLDLDAASDLIAKRYKDVETLARKWQRESRAYREKYHRAQSEAHEKIAYRTFKEGDLALFLPTRNQATRPWAAFNVGAPHYFLREQDGHKLQSRDWLLARISKVEERVVDLSRSMQDRRSLQAETSDAGSTRSLDDENPFELSDGLRWYMIDALEEKPGAPTTPGLGKSTVAATNIDARGSIQLMKEKKQVKDSMGSGNAAMATKTLSKSLDSRRSSSGSKKGHSTGQSISSVTGIQPSASVDPSGEQRTSEAAPKQRVVAESSGQATTSPRENAPIFEEVRKDLLFGP